MLLTTSVFKLFLFAFFLFFGLAVIFNFLKFQKKIGGEGKKEILH